MPDKIVTLRRWQVAAAFLVLAAAFTAGLIWVQHTSLVAHDAASRATFIASQNRTIIRERRAANIKTLTLICRKQNQSNSILSDLLQRISRLPPSRTLTPREQRAENRFLRIVALELRRLRPRDCQQLPATKP